MVISTQTTKRLAIYAPDVVFQDTVKKHNFIVAKCTENGIKIIPHLSDATIDEVSQYQLIFDEINSSEKIKSEYCSIQKTCLTRIVGTNLIADNNETISYLCRAGARSITMRKLEKLRRKHHSSEPSKQFTRIISNKYFRDGINTTEIENIVELYCYRYRGENYFGWAEFVFVQNFLKNRKFNKKLVGEK